MSQKDDQITQRTIDTLKPKFIYRVISLADLKQAQQLGIMPMSSLDERDGFIHLSSKESALETANLYFKPQDEPFLMELAVSEFGVELRWEIVESRKGQIFPHLYLPHLPMSMVKRFIKLEINRES